MQAARDAGFTLLEVIVALVVLGLLMAGLAGGTRLGLTGWHVQDRLQAAQEGLEPVDRAIGRLVEAADPGSPDGRGTMQGDASRMTMIVPAELLGRKTPQVDRLDVAIGIEHGSGHKARLVLRSLPHIHARALHAVEPEIRQTVLLYDVHAIAFSYLDPADHRWHDAWQANALPSLIRLHIERREPPRGGRGNTDRDAWPDLVWAPMRSRSD